MNHLKSHRESESEVGGGGVSYYQFVLKGKLLLGKTFQNFSKVCSPLDILYKITLALTFEKFSYRTSCH